MKVFRFFIKSKTSDFKEFIEVIEKDLTSAVEKLIEFDSELGNGNYEITIK